MSRDSGYIYANALMLREHADLCREERRIAASLEDGLKRATAYAPPELIGPTRKLTQQAADLARYFSGMADALSEAGDLTDETSRKVLELLEDADAGIKALLKD